MQTSALSRSLEGLLSVSRWAGLPGQIVSFRLSWAVSTSPPLAERRRARRTATSAGMVPDETRLSVSRASSCREAASLAAASRRLVLCPGGGSWRSPCWRLWSLLDFADFPDAAWPSVVSSVLSAPSVRSTSFTLAEGSVLNTEPAVWVSDSNRGWRARLSASRVHRSRPAAPFRVSTGDSQASSPCGVPSPGIAELCVTARMRLQTGRGCHPCRC